MKSHFSIFMNKWFSLYFLSATLSKIGDNVYRFAIPFLVLEMTNSVGYMTAMWVVEILPFIILGPFLGVLVDRLDRRKMMLWSDFLRALFIALIPTLAILHVLELWMLFVIGFMLSIFTICFDLVADFGLLPKLVSKEDLTKANSFFRGMDELSRMIGPIIAGSTIALVGAENALIIDAISYFFTFIIIAIIPISFNNEVVNNKMLTVKNVFLEIGEGLTYIYRSKILFVMALIGCSVNLGLGALFTVMVYYLGSELQLSSTIVGSIYSIMGCATLLGALLAPSLLKFVSMGRAIALTGILSFIGTIILALVSHWIIALVGYCIIMICSTMMNIYTFTVRQLEIPSQLMGRVNSAYRMILTVSFPISAALLGGLAETFNSKTAFLASMLAMVITVFLVIFTQVTSYSERKENNIHLST